MSYKIFILAYFCFIYAVESSPTFSDEMDKLLNERDSDCVTFKQVIYGNNYCSACLKKNGEWYYDCERVFYFCNRYMWNRQINQEDKAESEISRINSLKPKAAECEYHSELIKVTDNIICRCDQDKRFHDCQKVSDYCKRV